MLLFITLPILPLVVFMLNRRLLKGALNNGVQALISALIIYFLMVGAAIASGWMFDSELASYDLNQDGFISETESTVNYQKTLDRWASDTGRAFAPITAGIFALVYFSILYMVLSGLMYIKRRSSSKNN